MHKVKNSWRSFRYCVNNRLISMLYAPHSRLYYAFMARLGRRVRPKITYTVSFKPRSTNRCQAMPAPETPDGTPKKYRTIGHSPWKRVFAISAMRDATDGHRSPYFITPRAHVESSAQESRDGPYRYFCRSISMSFLSVPQMRY